MLEVHGGKNRVPKAPAAHDAPDTDHEIRSLQCAHRSALSDDRLAKRAASGDIGALEAIFARYRDDLYRFCVGILREPQDAQDAVQNTMVKVMRALPGERRQMQLKPWLYRIAHNEAVELRRRERPVEELPVTAEDMGPLTDERAEENGRLRTLLADIADLPERQRASLVMREVNGLGYGEIGAALGTSPGAVRQALYEARRGLAEMDDGRDMQCDLATRMISDADGRPRDRGVRAHLRDCSSCRRFQGEIGERGRTFAAISPMSAIAVAGVLKAALGGSGAATGGSGAAAVAGSAGAGASGAGAAAAGSIGASVLLKPAVGLLAVLAIGTAAVGHGPIFEAGRRDPVRGDGGKPTSALAEPPDIATALGGHAPAGSHEVAWDSGGPSTAAPITNRVDRVDPTTPPVAERPGVSVAPQPRAGGDPQGHDEVAVPPVVPRSPVLDGTGHDEALMPAAAAPATAFDGGGEPGASGGDAPARQAKKERAPSGQAKKEAESDPAPAPGESSISATPETEAPKAPPGQAKKDGVPPGQAKKATTPMPRESPTAGGSPAEAPQAPPGQAKKQGVPPGQAKKEIGAETPAYVPPGQAKKESVPPGQAKKEAATVPAPMRGESSTGTTPEADSSKTPPGQAKKQAVKTSEPTATESSAPASTPVVAATHVPPGHSKKEAEAVPAPEPSEDPAAPVELTEAPKVAAGQVKKAAAATE